MMDVLCVDKTGTITLNKLSVADITELDSYTKEDAILYGALASSEANQDPIDVAFIEAAKQKGLDTAEYARSASLLLIHLSEEQNQSYKRMMNASRWPREQ
ncbi:hypothetical protein [Methanosarcina horonobensis]|uniref:hypothetical protein n=1 Tax=Methanosarcina horonobensis TaxID=418008 RepID=UPI000AE5A4A1|nr:hypothetical protein [Methanosarcina horonobensis]